MNLKVLGAVVAALAVGGALTIAPRSADAKPEFAASICKSCGTCHSNPTGGGALKAFGAAYKTHGYKLPDKKFDPTIYRHH